MVKPIKVKEVLRRSPKLEEVLRYYCERGDYAAVFEIIMSRVISMVVEEGIPVNLEFFILDAYKKRWKSGITGGEVDSILLRVRATKKFKEYAKELIEGGE